MIVSARKNLHLPSQLRLSQDEKERQQKEAREQRAEARQCLDVRALAEEEVRESLEEEEEEKYALSFFFGEDPCTMDRIIFKGPGRIKMKTVFNRVVKTNWPRLCLEDITLALPNGRTISHREAMKMQVKDMPFLPLVPNAEVLETGPLRLLLPKELASFKAHTTFKFRIEYGNNSVPFEVFGDFLISEAMNHEKIKEWGLPLDSIRLMFEDGTRDFTYNSVAHETIASFELPEFGSPFRPLKSDPKRYSIIHITDFERMGSGKNKRYKADSETEDAEEPPKKKIAPSSIHVAASNEREQRLETRKNKAAALEEEAKEAAKIKQDILDASIGSETTLVQLNENKAPAAPAPGDLDWMMEEPEEPEPRKKTVPDGKRPVGTSPITDKHVIDAVARRNHKEIIAREEKFQKMITPVTKTDEYKSGEIPKDPAREAKEKKWPRVLSIKGIYCETKTVGSGNVPLPKMDGRLALYCLSEDNAKDIKALLRDAIENDKLDIVYTKEEIIETYEGKNI